MTVALLTWNLAWKSRQGRSGRVLAQRIEACAPDIDASLTARAVTGLSNVADGRQLSDHFGLAVVLARAQEAVP
ncbi:hypothetical protein [Amorphus sp. MBR-141]